MDREVVFCIGLLSGILFSAFFALLIWGIKKLIQWIKMRKAHRMIDNFIIPDGWDVDAVAIEKILKDLEELPEPPDQSVEQF